MTPCGSRPCAFHQRPSLHDFGYLLIEFVEEGQMLSTTWEEYRNDPVRQANLYRSLSRLMLALAKYPLPVIGSWTVSDQGELLLENRPLTWNLQQQENYGVKTGIPRDLTYSASEPYYLDLLSALDHRIRGLPNSIHHENDGRSQLAMLTAMKAILARFVNRKFRSSPFMMSLTDLHRSNIFVDRDWNITKVIDLEWACVRPLELLASPHWISGQKLEDLVDEAPCQEYADFHNKFAAIFEEEEMSRYGTNEMAEILRSNWTSGAFWYFTILYNPTALHLIFENRIQPRFMKVDDEAVDKFCQVVSNFWNDDVASFIAGKVEEQKSYDEELREVFAAEGPAATQKTQNAGE